MAGEPKMQGAEPRDIATELFRRFNDNDLRGALDLLADDATWWMNGSPSAAPATGEHSKAQISELLVRMAGQLKDGLRMHVIGTIAECDRVAVEVEGRGELRDGRVYANRYHFAMTVRDGKIAAVREYLDTHHVVEIWSRP